LSRIRRVARASWSGDPIAEAAGSSAASAPGPNLTAVARARGVGDTQNLTASLERGDVLFLPSLTFEVDARDTDLFSPAILSSGKNISFDPAAGRLSGTTVAAAQRERLRGLLARFSDSTQTLVEGLFPRYRGRFQRARASFRPAEIAGRQTSWRKDDTRLHVDSFPATPVQGRRILRVFSNVNPSGRPRVWRVGPEFSTVAERFGPRLSGPLPGSAWLLRVVRVTKARRSPYDALMLQLHDQMKADSAFQQSCEQECIEFPSGSTWIAFTDSVSHAALSGQHQLEQTFLVPVEAMEDEQRSPLRILERLKGRALV
jgi:hypothetical protein